MKIFVLLFAFWGMLQPAVQTLDQSGLKDYLENGAPFEFVLVDVREPSEISTAIGSSGCKPYNLSWPDQFKELTSKIAKDQAIVVYCRSGVRAGRAAEYLNSQGYTRVYNAGGILTWTGPTIQPSDLKPASLLPENSCGKKR